MFEQQLDIKCLYFIMKNTSEILHMLTEAYENVAMNRKKKQ